MLPSQKLTPGYFEEVILTARMGRPDRHQLRDAAKTAVGLFGDLALVLRMATVMLAPMLLAAAVGFIIAEPGRWTEGAVGAAIGSVLFAGLSCWAYRPWRRWGRWARVGLVTLQVFTLLAAIAAAASIHRRVRQGDCPSLYRCVSSAVQQFLDEASD